MEANESLPGFAEARRAAERSARTKERPEVTLEEIYELIDPKFSELASKEMAYEAQVLQRNPEMKKIFDLALEMGKHIILLSDMYLPSSFISEMLRKNGFDGYERLYMSCEHRKSKHFGDLFKLALDDLGISPGELLHIGDNKISDVRTPSELEIAVAPYGKVIDRYFESHRREYRFYRRKKDLERSLIVGMDALGWVNGYHDSEYWHILGYRYGGPLLTAFATFISRCAERKEGVILFIARDGCGPRRAYNILYGDVENHYIHAPRAFNILFGINGRDYPGYEEQIAEYFSDAEEVKSLGSGGGEELFEKNREVFKGLMEKELERYRAYMSRFTDGKDPVYVVDATTKKFSSQRLIETASGKESSGIYYTMLSKKDLLENRAFREYRKVYLSLTRIDVPEFLMSSPEPPVSGLDAEGHPIFSEIVPEERFRLDVIEQVMAGEDEYARHLKSVFGELVPSFGYRSLEGWISSLTSNMTPKDREEMSKLHWASDPAHSRYHGIVFSPKETFAFLWEKVGSYYMSLRRRTK